MEPLADPLKDRQVPEVECPPAKPLAEKLLFPDGLENVPDWKGLRTHCFKEGRVQKSHCLELIRRVSSICSCEPNLLKLKDPITVVGDIHGQYYDMLKLLDVGGDPDETQYLFLGDYVDRGSFSIEVLLILFALKLNHPDRVWLLRGNHECRQMTAFFNFRDECEYKYDMEVYHAFMDAFDTLAVSAVVNGKFIALHGGLSPDLRVLSQIGGVNRFQEPPRAGLFCDLLWADPVDDDKEEHSAHTEPFFPNDVRGCSFFFGYEAAASFLDRNGLLSVIRAHEAQLEGYKMHQTNSKTGFPTVITIFSAPNYCDCYNNKGAILRFENNTLNIQQFNFSPHPYHLPNFMDVFTWSIPFVSEKVTEMLFTMLHPTADEEGAVTEEEEEEAEEAGEESELPLEIQRITRRSMELLPVTGAGAQGGGGGGPGVDQQSEKKAGLSKERAEALRRKVQSVARVRLMFRTLREQNELIVQLKGFTPGHRIPLGALLKGEEGLKSELQKFATAKKIDLVNERRPSKDSNTGSGTTTKGGSHQQQQQQQQTGAAASPVTGSTQASKESKPSGTPSGGGTGSSSTHKSSGSGSSSKSGSLKESGA